MNVTKTCFLAGLGATALLAAPLHGEKVSCTLAEALKPGGQRTTELILDLKGDDVIGLLYDVSIGMPGKSGVSTIHVALSSEDGLSRWSRNGTSLRIIDTSRVEDSLDGAYVQIDLLPDAYRVDLSHISRNHFTNEADIQQSVTLKRGDKTCAVVYRNPQPKS